MSITVLTPTMGYGRFIGDALESVRLQGPGVEHLVQDAGSKDETVDVLRASSARWFTEPDAGQSDALNRALARSSSEWVGWLNADEFYLPGAMALLRAAGERTDADVVYGDVAFVDVGGRLIRLLPQHEFSRAALRWYGAYMSSCAALFRRSALAPAPWDVGLTSIMDWDLYLTLAGQGAKFVHVPHPVAAFRVHSDRVTSSHWTAFSEEYRQVERKHSVPRPRIRKSLGRLLHGALKLRDGAVGRRRRAAPFGGMDIRWFAGSPQAENLAGLVATAYPSER